VGFHTLQRETLEITAFSRARDDAEHFKAYYGPAIALRANAAKHGRAEELFEALDLFCDRWNLGTPDQGRFEKEYRCRRGGHGSSRWRSSCGWPT